MISAMVITLRTAQASPMTAAACALVPALDPITSRAADAPSSTTLLVRPARSLRQACIFEPSPPAALASGVSGQRGNSMVRTPRASEDARKRADDSRPEPGSSAPVGAQSNLIE